MRLLGYPANKISILTTYNGQKLLIRDVIDRRCVPYPFIGPPSKVTTVDKFRGQQKDFVLLSLVRTRFVGHLRDVRRLVVAMSRARLGLYVFCRRSLFEQCYELQPTFQLLPKRPDRLALNLKENISYTERHVEDIGEPYLVGGIEHMGDIVNGSYQARVASYEYHQYMAYASSMDASQEPSGQQSSMPVHDAMDTDGPASANGSQGVMPDGNQSQESIEMDGQSNGDLPLENRSNRETETEVPSNSENGMPRESDLNEDTKRE